MSGEFGAVSYDEEQKAAGTAVGGVTGAAETQAPEIDENDPRLTSETLDVNQEGDAYAFPPPPPDAKYRVKLKLVPTKVKVGSTTVEKDFKAAAWGEQKVPCYVASIEAAIQDPSGKYDGIKLYDQNVSTFTGRDKSSKVTTILGKLRKPDGTPYFDPKTPLNKSPRGWMDMFVKALSGEPEVGIESNWEFSCIKCGEEAEKKHEKRPRGMMGMHKFPPAKPGASHGMKNEPEMQCAANPAHGYGRARPQIVRFLALSELK
jgi:hypothetical protein